MKNTNRGPSELADDLLRSLDKDMGRVFEDVCAEYLVERFGGTAGRWWGPDPRTRAQEEIDLVITLGRGDGMFVECEYRNEPVDKSVLDTLVRRSLLVKGYGERRYVLASKSGFADDIPRDGSVLLLTLDDVIERPDRE